MTDVAVVINDCAEPSAGDVRPVRMRGASTGEGNWRFNPDRLGVGLPEPLTARQLDWLEIHGAIFAADRAVQREPRLGWTRSIALHVPVREPEFWEGHVAAFQDIFASLTYDRLHLVFHRGTNFAEAPRQRTQPFPEADAVALLSGGLDSFVGALELLDRGAKPLFVAASGSGATGRSQSDVFDVIDAKDDARRELLKLTAQRKSGFPGDERSQRSRSFLFTAGAALVASALGIEDVYLNENGVMAVHVPLTAARIGSLSTRTASPRVVKQMADLASAALGATIRIENLLVGMTKPEVVERGVELGHGNDLQKSVSCWSISHRPHHCGQCAPCLTRRIACSVHGVHDVTYEADVFADPAALNEAATDVLVHMIQLAEDFRDSSDGDLRLDYPELLGGGVALSTDDAIAMYRRWSDQALGVLGKQPVPAEFIS